MRALLWREFRGLSPLIGIACVLGAPFAVVLPYSPLLPILGFVLGARTLAEDGSPPLREWTGTWPASRKQLWLAKVVVNLAVLVCAIGVVIGAMRALVAVHELGLRLEPVSAPSVMRENYQILISMVDTGAWFALAAFGLAVLFSGLQPTSQTALAAALLTGAGMAAVYGLCAAGARQLMTGPYLGPHLGFAGSHPWIVVATLAGPIALWASARGVISAPPLDAAARTRRTWRPAAGGALVMLPVFTLLGLSTGAPGRRELTSALGPSVSPDGKRIAFAGGHDSSMVSGSPGLGLWVMNADGSGMRCVARGYVDRAQWLADSRHLVFAWSGGATGSSWRWAHALRRHSPGAVETPGHPVYVVDCTTGRVAQLTGDGGQDLCLAWSAEHLALIADQVCRLDPSGVVRKLAIPRWAPLLGCSADETKLYIGEPFDGPESAVAAIDVTTGVKTPGVARAPRLSSDEAAGTRPASGRSASHALRPGALGTLHPVPVPEQDRWWAWATVATWCSRNSQITHSSGPPLVIFTERHTAAALQCPGEVFPGGMSPDGRYVWLLVDGKRGLAVADLTVAARASEDPPALAPVRRLDAVFPQLPSCLLWSPDHRRVAFSVATRDRSRPQEQTEPVQVWVADADGRNLHMVLSDATLPRASALGFSRQSDTAARGWTADGELVVSIQTMRLLKIDPATGRQVELLRLPETSRTARP